MRTRHLEILASPIAEEDERAFDRSDHQQEIARSGRKLRGGTHHCLLALELKSSIAWSVEVKKATSPDIRQGAPASWSIRRDANCAPGLIRKGPDAGSVWSFRLDLRMLPSTAFQVG